MHAIHELVEWTAVGIDLTASLIMVVAFLMSVYGLVRGGFNAGSAHGRIRNLQVVRCELGVKLVFALEMLIIADLLHTVISRSLDDLILVGGLVVIRTVIAYFLNKEIEEVGAKLAQPDTNV
jgi:uncharacterized membrane protein